MFYYILNIKMTSQSFSNVCIEHEPQATAARSSVQFDNDCDVIFMFKDVIEHGFPFYVF